jgi:thioredoxin reductase
MVIVATGTSPEQLNIPGEREFQMRGLCYSAITYAQLFIDRNAIVVGDGPLALRSTLELALIAQRVRLVAPTAAGLATPLGQRLRAMDNVDIITDVEPQEVQGIPMPVACWYWPRGNLKPWRQTAFSSKRD